jgi:hypothetical protein
METLWEKYKAKGLNVLFATETYGYFGDAQGIPADAEFDSLTHYFAQAKVTIPIAVTGAFTGASPDLARPTNSLNYVAAGLPTIVLIDRKGIVRAVWPGWNDQLAADIESQVEKVMDEGSSSVSTSNAR